MTKKALARLLGFDPSYISHIEAGRHQAGEEFARLADLKLAAGGRAVAELAGLRTRASSSARPLRIVRGHRARRAHLPRWRLHGTDPPSRDQRRE
ncbi:helix-turn-helix domain-containing protein [Nocardiopsis rhodophaea]|uniref:helix-turn-helix domain-containing protein n=1 Tax=Nocardiopsis rhodophaea TaxID=280238 RepID=UPI00399CD85E